MTAVLRYPYEAITSTTDYFQITIKKYDPATIAATPAYGTFNAQNVSSNSSGNPNPAQLVDDGIILLPMPANITDRKEVGYGPDSLDAVSKLGADIVNTGVEGFGNALAAAATEGKGLQVGSEIANQTVQQIASKLVGQESLGDQVVAELTANAASLIPGVNVTAKQLLTRTQGKILNPNMELLFDGPSLRSFGFQFKMTPRDRTEAGQIKSIIRSLKKNMSPRVDVGGAGNFLTTPNIFEIAYRKGGNNHPFLHKFKQCALKDLSINYTGENVYATYDDGTPISTTMTLSFQELVPIYDKDYNDKAADGSYTNNFNQAQLQYSENGPTEGVGY